MTGSAETVAMGQEAANGVHAVVVSWRPGPILDQVITAIAPTVDRVWIVDNGSGAETEAQLDALAGRFAERVSIIVNPANLGLAKAQNQGIEAALEQGADWILLLDHDSVAATGMVEAMLAAHREDAAPDTVGLLAPVLFDARGTLRQTHWVAGPPLWVPRRRSVPPRSIVDGVFFTIASGSLIPAAALRRIGGMREAFFVDYVDFDFAFRLRAAGLRLVGVGDARLEHRLGEPRTKRLLGREVSVNTHSAIRRRTIYRNRTRLWREYGFRMPGFVAFELASVAIDLAKLALIEDDKIAKLGAIVLGMTDGLFGPSERLRTRVRFDRS